MGEKTEQAKNSGANLGFEAQLGAAAKALRLPVRAGNARTQTGGSMDAAEYKHVVLMLMLVSLAFTAGAREVLRRGSNHGHP